VKVIGFCDYRLLPNFLKDDGANFVIPGYLDQSNRPACANFAFIKFTLVKIGQTKGKVCFG
jgi:hypothetical protein